MIVIILLAFILLIWIMIFMAGWAISFKSTWEDFWYYFPPTIVIFATLLLLFFGYSIFIIMSIIIKEMG